MKLNYNLVILDNSIFKFEVTYLCLDIKETINYCKLSLIDKLSAEYEIVIKYFLEFKFSKANQTIDKEAKNSIY